jgi:hypothetical protein
MHATRGNWIKAAGLIAIGIAIGVAVPRQLASAAKDTKRPDPPRIGYVNIAKVLRDYKLANQEGRRIT